MDNGFTGINFDLFDAELLKIEDSYDAFFVGLTDRFSVFFWKLRKEWASQNAYNVSLEWHTQINGYLRTFKELYDRIYNDLIVCGQSYAGSTGQYWSPKTTGLITGFTELDISDVALNVVSDTGITGMNTILVEDLLMSSLPKIRDGAIEAVNKLPASISMYDTNGDQAAVYSTRKQTIITLVDELLSSIEATIRGYIETEKDSILLAKQQTVQNLNGTSNSINA